LHGEEEDGLRDHARHHRVLNHHAQHGPGPAYTPSLKRLNRAEATAIEGRASPIHNFTKQTNLPYKFTNLLSSLLS
jgi:hypothetical protein